MYMYYVSKQRMPPGKIPLDRSVPEEQVHKRIAHMELYPYNVSNK